ncbi:MAG: hypothetical protein PHT07_21355 [Paludibacter sp.]|nr:hypothetical protein [Paludibacter sp.]
MKKYSIVTLFIGIILLIGCSEDFQLQKSVFINDVNNPGLPEYSEWGYNTFGAYIDRTVFASTDNDLPGKIVVNKDTFNLILKGKSGYETLSLKFSIIGYSPADYPDLISLNDSIIDLKIARCIVTLGYPYNSKKLAISEGKLYFKRVQNLYVDKVLTETIVSGTFNFKTILDGEPVAISNGRFDLGIGYDNFFKY